MQYTKQSPIISFLFLLLIGVGVYFLIVKTKPYQSPIDAVISDSFVQPIPAVSVGGVGANAFAVLLPDLIKTVDLKVPAYRAYGLYKGWLAFASLNGAGSAEDKLRVVNISTGENRILAPDWSIHMAVWRPGNLMLAVAAYINTDSALLFINTDTGEITKHVDGIIRPIIWNKDGSVLYAQHEIHPPEQRLTEETLYSLVSYSAAGELLRERSVDDSVAMNLFALDEFTLDEILKNVDKFPWQKVPRFLDSRGELGLPIVSSGKLENLGSWRVLWRHGNSFLANDYSNSYRVLKSINILTGTASEIILK